MNDKQYARTDRRVVQGTSMSITELLTFGFSWMLVMAIGLMPLADTALGRTPSITTPMAITFSIAIGSAILLRRRHSWIGLVLHIYGQIAIWLSIFVLSMCAVLLLAEHG